MFLPALIYGTENYVLGAGNGLIAQKLRWGLWTAEDNIYSHVLRFWGGEL